MKKYISVDDNPKFALFASLITIFIPIFGPWYVGTRFTSRYKETRVLAGLLCVISFVIHFVGLLVGLIQLCKN